jgi:hypothetical protein
MESGLPGLEYQTHGRATSKSWMTGGNAVEKLQKDKKQEKSACFLGEKKADRIFIT